jgi:tetratricopeptide (TPR) repeat protein
VARLDLELGSYAAAEAELEQVLTRTPSSADALRTLVDLHQRTANHSGLVAALVRLSSQQTDLEAAVGALKQAAQVTLATQDDTEAAEKLLSEALQRVDAAPAVTPAQKELVRRALGQVLVPLFELARQKGRTEEAQALAQRAIREAELIGNRAAELQVHLGQEALATGRPTKRSGSLMRR